LNLRIGENFDFSDEEGLKALVDNIIPNTENEEGLNLLLIANNNQ